MTRRQFLRQREADRRWLFKTRVRKHLNADALNGAVRKTFVCFRQGCTGPNFFSSGQIFLNRGKGALGNTGTPAVLGQCGKDKWGLVSVR